MGVIKTNTPLLSSSEGAHFFGLDQEVFLSLNGTNKAIGVIFGTIDLTKDTVEKAISDLSEKLDIPVNQIDCKILGRVEKTNLVSEYIASSSFQSVKIVNFDSPVEIVYIPEEGRIRLSKEITGAQKPFYSPPPKVEKSESSAEDNYTGPKEIKVLIVDDSSSLRLLLSKIFKRDPRIKIVGMADRPSKVEPLIKEHRPDVMTMDIHMPEMDGVSLFKKLHPIYRIPTIMISSVSVEEGTLVLDAIENGAFDYIQKPALEDLEDVAKLMIDKVKAACQVDLQALKAKLSKRAPKKAVFKEIDSEALIVIGSSTGGTNALKDIMEDMPSQVPPIIIVQHIPALFSAALAERLDRTCDFKVKEGEDGEFLEPNTCYVAPGGKQMAVKQIGERMRIVVNDDPPLNRFKPSVDYLFNSVAKYIKENTVGVILTGMGDDGAKGLLELKKKGAKTIAQDKESSVVFGMPKVAIEIGAVDHITSLDDMANKIVELSSKDYGKKKAS